jgi:hypothetical protein
VAHSLGDSIDYSCTEENGKCLVVEVRCKLCSKHIDKLKRDDRVKGPIAKEVEVFANGSDNVKKHAVTRHLSGKVHSIALEFERLLGTAVAASSDSPASTSSSSTSHGHQPKINTSLSQASRTAYGKLFKTAYKVATDGLPLKAYTSMVQLQKENGVKLLNGK